MKSKVIRNAVIVSFAKFIAIFLVFYPVSVYYTDISIPVAIGFIAGVFAKEISIIVEGKVEELLEPSKTAAEVEGGNG